MNFTRVCRRRRLAPPVAVGEEVVDHHRQVVVGVHQTAVGRHDPVPVGVRVVAGRDVVAVEMRAAISEAIALGGTAIHPDLAIGVEGREAKGRIGGRVDHLQRRQAPLPIAAQ